MQDLLNRALAAALSTDPDSRARFGEIDGKVFCLEFTAPRAKIFLSPDASGVRVSWHAERADVTLRASAFAFAEAALRGGAADSRIEMRGDVDAGRKLQKIFAQLDLDWEELLARAIGDLPAREVGACAREVKDWLRESAEYGGENLADYFREEKKMLASEARMQRHADAVAELRADAEHLARRVAALKNPRDA